MPKPLTTPYDTAEYLKTDEDMAQYLEAALKKRAMMLHLSPRPWATSPVHAA